MIMALPTRGGTNDCVTRLNSPWDLDILQKMIEINLAYIDVHTQPQKFPLNGFGAIFAAASKAVEQALALCKQMVVREAMYL